MWRKHAPFKILIPSGLRNVFLLGGWGVGGKVLRMVVVKQCGYMSAYARVAKILFKATKTRVQGCQRDLVGYRLHCVLLATTSWLPNQDKYGIFWVCFDGCCRSPHNMFVKCFGKNVQERTLFSGMLTSTILSLTIRSFYTIISIKHSYNISDHGCIFAYHAWERTCLSPVGAYGGLEPNRLSICR